MKVGIALPKNAPESFKVCVESVVKYFPRLALDYCITTDPGLLQSVDVIWDPCSGGGKPPSSLILSLEKPLVVTLHGVAPLALSTAYCNGLWAKFSLLKNNFIKRRIWKDAHECCAVIVTVSEFSKRSIVQHLPIPEDKLVVIPNAVDYSKFHDSKFHDSKLTEKLSELELNSPYFFHISNDQKRKNVDKIISAYSELDCHSKWPLLIKIPSARYDAVDGVHFYTQRLDHQELVYLYRQAGALVFPSIYEGFGLPILEAMAAGCPVITANTTACAEVSGNAAPLVDPNSISDLANAMQLVQSDESLCNELVRKGWQRAKEYNWEDAAQQYMKVFELARER